MKVYKHGKKFRISYKWNGKTCNESFDNEKSAVTRGKLIEYEMAEGKFVPPCKTNDFDENHERTRQTMTVKQLMKIYVSEYGLRHWSSGTLSCNQHRIDDYIIPYLGKVHIKDLTTHRLEKFYQSLQAKPAVQMKGHKNTGQTVSISVIERVHTIIRSALNQAIRWDFLQGANPAQQVILPRVKSEKRAVWTAEDCKKALSVCDNPILRLCLLLALSCSMRIGEILGLTWDCIHIEPELVERHDAYLFVNKEIRRCDKSSLKALAAQGRNEVFLTFPEWKRTGCKTALVLKTPKTESSVRTIYLSQASIQALKQQKEQQEQYKTDLGEEYQDFNLVVTHPNGRPIEERYIAEQWNKFIAKNDLPPVVFHSLRHTSTSLKLRISGGDIKAVQGDTGHAQSNMVTDVYSHTMNDDRKLLASKMDEQFFDTPLTESSTTISASADPAVSQLMQMLNESPEFAQTLLHLTQMMGANKPS